MATFPYTATPHRVTCRISTTSEDTNATRYAALRRFVSLGGAVGSPR